MAIAIGIQDVEESRSLGLGYRATWPGLEAIGQLLGLYGQRLHDSWGYRALGYAAVAIWLQSKGLCDAAKSHCPRRIAGRPKSHFFSLSNIPEHSLRKSVAVGEGGLGAEGPTLRPRPPTHIDPPSPKKTPKKICTKYEQKQGCKKRSL